MIEFCWEVCLIFGICKVVIWFRIVLEIWDIWEIILWGLSWSNFNYFFIVWGWFLGRIFIFLIIVEFMRLLIFLLICFVFCNGFNLVCFFISLKINFRIKWFFFSSGVLCIVDLWYLFIELLGINLVNSI